jgi:hypothetical protein
MDFIVTTIAAAPLILVKKARGLSLAPSGAAADPAESSLFDLGHTAPARIAVC